jgi:hypothetical protein
MIGMPGLRRGIAFALLAELPGIPLVAIAAPSLAAHGPLVLLAGGAALLLAGSALGLGLLALWTVALPD